mmetsp:Transcript_3803/g.10818  ORF Transcript_3803/g.10818 Transcript_3803/m.10818 type:complete len:224 (-) Transcript_3803:1792-2463(-)
MRRAALHVLRLHRRRGVRMHCSRGVCLHRGMLMVLVLRRGGVHVLPAVLLLLVLRVRHGRGLLLLLLRRLHLHLLQRVHVRVRSVLLPLHLRLHRLLQRRHLRAEVLHKLRSPSIHLTLLLLWQRRGWWQRCVQRVTAHVRLVEHQRCGLGCERAACVHVMPGGAARRPPRKRCLCQLRCVDTRGEDADVGAVSGPAGARVARAQSARCTRVISKAGHGQRLW